jgi:hypothetical protein
MNGFAVVVPVGPGQVERLRFLDLIDSLQGYEPEARLCVVIDSSPFIRRITPLNTHGCRFIILRAPYQGQGKPLQGRLSAGMLLALDCIRRQGPFHFVLRADTDALIAGKFTGSVKKFLLQHPKTGMLGTLGHTCRRDSPYYGCEKSSISDVAAALPAMPSHLPAYSRLDNFHAVACRNGYVGKEYCQGGIYVLAFRTLERLFGLGCFNHPEDWLTTAVPEDVMMGMLTRTAGLECSDFSSRGEPFASNYRGLAYSPGETLRRKHVLIHSVKSDPRYSETVLRRFFRIQRSSGRK